MSRQGGRINPSHIAVPAAINQVDTAVSGVAKDDYRHAGHVELGNRFAHRAPLQRGGRFGDDYRIERGSLILVAMLSAAAIMAIAACFATPLLFLGMLLMLAFAWHFSSLTIEIAEAPA